MATVPAIVPATYDPQLRLTFSWRTGLDDQRNSLLMLVAGVTRRADLRCFHCGRRRTLVFDHLDLRDYHPRRLNQATRLRTYYREWVMAGREVGKAIVASCDPCNSTRAKEHQHAYTPALRRRRNGPRPGAYVRQAYELHTQEDDAPF